MPIVDLLINVGVCKIFYLQKRNQCITPPTKIPYFKSPKIKPPINTNIALS